MRVLVLIALVGCGGSSKEPAKPECLDCGLGPGGVHGDDAFVEQKTRTMLCERARVHASAECPPFDRMNPTLLETCSVVTSFQLAGMDRCLGENGCDALAACFDTTRAATNPPAYRGPTRACELPGEHDDLAYPAAVSRDEIADSYGATDRTYADSPSSREKPIEVCGFPAAGAWLARITCTDGSRPFPTRSDADRARVGNVGGGGRCGRIVDHYRVECPEKQYDIYIDAYRCPK